MAPCAHTLILARTGPVQGQCAAIAREPEKGGQAAGLRTPNTALIQPRPASLHQY